MEREMWRRDYMKWKGRGREAAKMEEGTREGDSEKQMREQDRADSFHWRKKYFTLL